ncbi:hypothetical protein BpHYR1_046553 [Brachionus plicatilis]|uniref:Uncharacterized protein n=1 Tax=Brachionus plicatilis TaxID=10195 RepID=A0A3M7RRK5_BRAPC|nr:hypothetical protein BpHYR1_046553 [Brachionus plicatilis]
MILKCLEKFLHEKVMLQIFVQFTFKIKLLFIAPINCDLRIGKFYSIITSPIGSIPASMYEQNKS